jgi:uncharacterized protein (DUF433 family)
MIADQQQRIVVNHAILNGKPCIKGTRISVEHVLDHLAGGWTVEAIVENYANLTQQDVAACLAYARDIIAGETVFPTAA